MGLLLAGGKDGGGEVRQRMVKTRAILDPEHMRIYMMFHLEGTIKRVSYVLDAVVIRISVKCISV